MRIIAISDTHAKHREVEFPPYQEGDILVHAGDITRKGEIATVKNFGLWGRDLPYKHKIVIAGNHDFSFQDERHNDVENILEKYGWTYLYDSSVEIDGLKFYGSPWQPWFYDWAFNVQRGPDIRRKWMQIPDDVDVLITHGPASGNNGGNLARPNVIHLPDRTVIEDDVGCEDLYERIMQLPNLKYHIHGHIHEAYGIYNDPKLSCKCVNASSLNLNYDCVNSPWILPISSNQ